MPEDVIRPIKKQKIMLNQEQISRAKKYCDHYYGRRICYSESCEHAHEVCVLMFSNDCRYRAAFYWRALRLQLVCMLLAGEVGHVHTSSVVHAASRMAYGVMVCNTIDIDYG